MRFGATVAVRCIPRRLSLAKFMLAILLGALTAAPAHFCFGCNYAGAQLSGANFAGAVYVGSNFEGAVLENASFRGAKLVAANFEGADLKGAALDGAECTACNFEDAKLDGATFSGARMVAANFNGFAAAVTDAGLRDLLSNCLACNFSKASLARRDLSNLTIIGVDFTQADLRHTKFDGSTLCYYEVVAAQRTTICDKLKGAQVAGASFSGVRVCDDPTQVQTCVPVDAASLRRYGGSTLDGAILP
jgi:uncharacterized protein YjbI with pentapeptide repeats